MQKIRGYSSSIYPQHLLLNGKKSELKWGEVTLYSSIKRNNIFLVLMFQAHKYAKFRYLLYYLIRSIQLKS